MSKNILAFLSSGGAPLAVGVLLLPLAIIGGIFYLGQLPPEPSQWPIWYAHYENGYMARGLLGTVFRFFHGAPTKDLINQVVPRWEATVIFISITLFWALLVTPIFVRKFTLPTKWLLLSFAAVILLSPVWRDNTFHVGFGDEWMVLFALFALIAIIAKRPLIYLLCILPSFLIHPSTLFYAALLSGIILHAILRTPCYAVRWRTWLAVMIAPFLWSLLLYSISSPETPLITLQPMWENHPYGEDWTRGNRLDWTHPGSTIRSALLVTRKLWWQSVITGTIVFGFPSLLLTLLFAASLVKWMKYEDSRIPYSWPLPPTMAKFLSRYDAHIILTGGAFLWAPIMLVAYDWSRFFMWSWWNIGLLVAYFLWTSGGDASKPGAKKKIRHKSPRHSVARTGITVFLFVWAYTFLGAPLNNAFIVAPKLFQCQRWCVFPLTVNPLGDWYSHGIYNTLIDSLNPTVRGTGKDLWGLTWTFRDSVELADDNLIIPPDFRGILLYNHRTLPAGRVFSITLRHESDGIPPITLTVNNQSLRPFQQSAKRTVWKFNTTYTGLYNMHLNSEGGKAFAISEFILGFED